MKLQYVKILMILLIFIIRGNSSALAFSNLNVLSYEETAQGGSMFIIRFDVETQNTAATIHIFQDNERKLNYRYDPKDDRDVYKKSILCKNVSMQGSISIDHKLSDGIYILHVYNDTLPLSEDPVREIIRIKGGHIQKLSTAEFIPELRVLAERLTSIVHLRKTPDASFEIPAEQDKLWIAIIHDLAQSRFEFQVVSEQDGEYPAYPVVSPDRSRMAYVVGKFPERKIVLRDYPSFRLLPQEEIAVSNTDYINPVWSRNGQKLAFLTNKDTFNPSEYDLWMLDIRRGRTSFERLTVNKKVTKILGWLQDDSQILFSCAKESHQQAEEPSQAYETAEQMRTTFFIDLHTKDIVQFPVSSKEQKIWEVLDTTSNLSSDGERVVFQRQSKSHTTDIWVTDFMQALSKPLTFGNYIDKYPAWIPGEKNSIIFVSNRPIMRDE